MRLLFKPSHAQCLLLFISYEKDRPEGRGTYQENRARKKIILKVSDEIKD